MTLEPSEAPAKHWTQTEKGREVLRQRAKKMRLWEKGRASKRKHRKARALRASAPVRVSKKPLTTLVTRAKKRLGVERDSEVFKGLGIGKSLFYSFLKGEVSDKTRAKITKLLAHGTIAKQRPTNTPTRAINPTKRSKIDPKLELLLDLLDENQLRALVKRIMAEG